MLFNKPFVNFFTLALLSVGFGNVAHAQQGAALEEVVVTASKRGAQSIQDTVGTIQAISSESLERSVVEGIEDYIKMVPGLTTINSGPGQSQVIIRGINTGRITHNAFQTRSLAGYYLDDMPISVAAFNPDLGMVDIERVEVLKGPQGTLYGGSSMSGTIRVITKKPDTEKISAKVSADVSDTKGGGLNYGYRGSINLPLSDSWALKLSGYSSQKSGYIDVVGPNPPSIFAVPQEDYNKSDIFGGKVQLAYYGDKLDAHATFIYHKLDLEGRPDEILPVASDPRLANLGERETVKFSRDPFNDEFTAANVTLDYDFEHINVVSSTSWTEVISDNILDDNFRIEAFLPFSPFTDAGQYSDFHNDVDTTTWVEEIRVSSTYDSRLQWILGFYLENQDKHFVQIQPTRNNDAFFCGGVTPCDGGTPDSIFDSNYHVISTQISFFGEATYDFTEALKLKLGFRWYDYDYDVDFFLAGAANGGIIQSVSQLQEDGVVPKVELSYDISDDHMVYATYSEGFRLGSVNRQIPPRPDCLAELAALGVTQGAPVESDSLENYEIGAKTSWLDNRLTANISVFRNDFSDIQSSIFLNCAFDQNANAGAIENTGFDLDMAFQATEALSLTLGLAYVDSEVTELAQGQNQEGDTPPYIPEWSGSASAQYSFPIWQGSGFIRGNVRYVGSSFNEFSSNPTVIKLDDYTVVDVNVGYEQNGWGVNVFARNLFDERIVTNIDPDRLQPNQATIARPRTVGISVSKSF